MTISFRGLPERAPADEPFNIVVSGLWPDARARIEVQLDHAEQQWFGDFAATADDRGVLDLSSTALEGFDRADPTALLWALEPAAGRSPTGEAARGQLRVSVGGEASVEQEFLRVFRADGVAAQEVGGDLAGVLYLPPGQGPHPAVVLLTGSGGGIAQDEAALLASRGFACLALAYFNYPGRPDELHEQPLEYFGQALDWLAAHPAIRNDAIAVKGRSRGGELSLLLGATFPSIRAVVAMVPSGYVWGAVRKDGHQGSAWTWRGRLLPKLSSVGQRPISPTPLTDADGATVLAPGFREVLADSPADSLEAAAIPVERTNGPILLICGGADQLWDSVLLSDIVLQRTAAAGFPFEVRRSIHLDAGHNLSVPYLPVVTSSVHPVSGHRLAYGGTRSGTAAARVAAWRASLAFLRTALHR